MQYTKQGHASYYTKYHIVFSTKYRRKIFNPGMCSYLRIKVFEIRKYYPELDIIEVNTDQDHLHILITIPPKMSVSQVVNIIKSNTAREMRIKFPFFQKVYWDNEGIWSIGYFVSTVGINEEIIQKYIQMQGKEDSGQAKLEL